MFGIGSTELVVLIVIVLIMLAGALAFLAFLGAVVRTVSRNKNQADPQISDRLAHIEDRLGYIERQLRNDAGPVTRTPK